MAKLTVADLVQMKQQGKKITEALVFDVTMTRIFEQAGADVLLVGDSYVSYLLGGSTDDASVEGMLLFATAVVRAALRAVITVDIPGPVCEAGPAAVASAAQRYKQEAGADLAKIDIPSADDQLIEETRAVVRAGLGADVRVRFRPDRAKTWGLAAEHEHVMGLVKAAQDAGASLIEIYEGTPELYEQASHSLSIPVLGGRWSTADADGKIFVYPNLVGYRADLVETAGSTAKFIYDQVAPYLSEVHSGAWETADKALYPQNRSFPA